MKIEIVDFNKGIKTVRDNYKINICQDCGSLVEACNHYHTGNSVELLNERYVVSYKKLYILFTSLRGYIAFNYHGSWRLAYSKRVPIEHLKYFSYIIDDIISISKDIYFKRYR
jgi:hypothetical protein